MNHESRIMNKEQIKEKKISSHNSCFIIRDSATPHRAGRGFALMFAILASTVLLSMSVAIWNIALREVVLSSYGRESQIAFYAADTGAECALYWDIKETFATSSDSAVDTSISCGGETIPVASGPNSVVSVRDNFNATTTFSMTEISGTCVDVSIVKHDPEGDGFSTTKIETFGHNVCDPTNPILLERGFRIIY